MYQYIYFDLDNTLVRDNSSSGKSEVLKSGYEKYMEMKKRYPNVPFRLFTNRLKNQITYPNVYTFDEVIGKEEMDLYIIEHMNRVPFTKYLHPLNLYIYLTGLMLFKRNQTPKVLYLFLRHITKGENIYVEDDDRRVCLTFRW